MTRRVFHDVKDGWDPDTQDVALIVGDSDGLKEGLLAFTSDLAELNYRVVYVAVSRPHGSVIRTLTRRNVDISKMAFIDMISDECDGDHNCVCTGSPTALTDLSIYTSESVRKAEKPVAVVVDSLSSLSIHNDTNTVQQLVHKLVSKIRNKEAHAVLGLLDTEEPYTRQVFSMIADSTIEAK